MVLMFNRSVACKASVCSLYYFPGPIIKIDASPNPLLMEIFSQRNCVIALPGSNVVVTVKSECLV